MSNEENFVNIIEEALRRQLEPFAAMIGGKFQALSGEFQELREEFHGFKAETNSRFDRLEEELQDVRATQDEHTRLLVSVANVANTHSEKIVDLSKRVSVLEHKVG